MASSPERTGAALAGGPAPIIVDLGKHGRKAIKNLRQGEGKLMDEVSRCIKDLQEAQTISSTAQPVIVIVRQKRRAQPLWPLG